MSGSPVILGERYELGEPLGRGGMATVHLAVDRRLQRIVAVKQLSLHLAADPTAQTRFRREAQASASLNHPAIAAVFDTGESVDPGTGVALPYIVMELVEGSTLRALLNSGPLPPERALRVVHSVLDALAHSHAMGLVHRDIKPANVMITDDGAVKVMDFGIARAIDESATSLTKTTSVIGTAHYLSPEQALGQKVDLRSDLYSVGCLLFELVTGRPPFVGDTSLAIVYQHVRENPVPPSQLQPSLDSSFDAVVLRALAKNPDDRYQDAAAMRDDVDRVLAGEPVAPPPPFPDPPTSEDTALLPGRLLAAPAAVAVAGTTDPAATAPRAPVAAVAEPALVDTGTEPPERRRPAAALIALAAFLVLGLVAFGAFRLFDPPTAANRVAVPNLVGKSQAQAELALYAVGLLARVTQGAGNDEGIGTVIKQDPVAAAEVRPGATVTLMVNAGGIATAKLPDDLVGRPVKDVERQLEALGFTDVSTEAVAAGRDVKPGEVVSVEPAEGTQVPLAAAVLVRFARGSAAATTSKGDDSTPPASAPRTSGAPTTSADPDGEPTDDQTQDGDVPPAGAPTTRAPATQAPATQAPATRAPTTRAPTRRPAPRPSATVPPAQNPTTAPQPQPTTTDEAEEPVDEDDKKGKGRGKGRGRGQGDDGD